MKIFIIVPVFNEGHRAVETIKKIFRLSKQKIIIVDDGSVDKSWVLLRRSFDNNKRVIMLRHVINLGKGAAMKTGVEMAWKLGAGAVIFIDADGQHDPKHLRKFEILLKTNNLVFGYRKFDSHMPFVRKWGNMFARKIIEFLFGVKRRDLLCGFLGFRKKIFKKIIWKSCRYGIETEIATKVGRNKIDFCEVKVDTIYIDKYKGVSMIDALKILMNIPWWYFRI